MNPTDYYHSVFSKLFHCFRYSDYFIASGRELLSEGADPAFPALAVPVSRLKEMTAERGLQIHLPIIGTRAQSVLMPLDFELFLADENHRLYTDRQSQRDLFYEILPVSRFMEDFFRSRGIPYLLDYTPSGGHILFQTLMGHRAAAELVRIGWLEEDLKRACDYRDPNDIRRKNGITREAARVFSALGKLTEYVSLKAMEAFKTNEAVGRLPVVISDALDRCINLDNTWNEGSPFMRSIRSPFSLHKKNSEKYDILEHGPLVDVIGTVFDGKTADEVPDIDHILDCMWSLEKAADHARRFSGHIPCSNGSLIDLVHEYLASDLYRFHREFEDREDIPRGVAVQTARAESRVPEWAVRILDHPNPAALQPGNLIGLVYDFLIRAHWPPRHIANILRDLYQDPAHGWSQDFFLYPAEEKANFWARTYSAVALWRTGGLRI